MNAPCKFKVGDKVIVNGTQDSICFHNAYGEIVEYRPQNGGYYGINFKYHLHEFPNTKTSFVKSTIADSFHDCENILSENTGWYIGLDNPYIEITKYMGQSSHSLLYLLYQEKHQEEKE